MPAKYLPHREIEFAVNVGFLTKKMWREFFAEGGLRWQQMLWRQLRTEGYFKARPDWPDLYLPNPTHPFVKERATHLARAPLREALLKHCGIKPAAKEKRPKKLSTLRPVDISSTGS